MMINKLHNSNFIQVLIKKAINDMIKFIPELFFSLRKIIFKHFLMIDAIQRILLKSSSNIRHKFAKYTETNVI
ncbi:unnamed protein product [Blepharisma stoltei]|uniref:Uncharacterized protein n=1 Tax=Blepharisma stoltei TaxID=1481888 RepID=A0AAU9IU20_9CILI|nr:unnamed protein product [Blepharisma stoltei]